MIQKKLIQMVFNRIEGANIEVTYWDGESDKFTSQSYDEIDFKINFNEKLNLNKVRKEPQLELGEAYMRGDIDVKGDFKEIIDLGARNFLGKEEILNKYQADSFWKNQQDASFEDQKQGVQHHYDLGNDFFKLWQDETMTYSCAYFQSEDDDLKQAQKQKIEHALNKLNLKSGEKLLDIGCGWGSLAIKAAKEYDVDVVGITLSDEQVIKARKKVKEEGLENKIEIKKQDYRNLAEKEVKFDKIVSIGMFEHVGKEHIPEYFQAIDKMLVEGGLSLLHSITHLKEQPTNPWLEKYIFPWGYIPSVREMVWELPENNFHLLDIENIGYHYSLTAERWLDNYEEVTDQVREMFDEKFVRMWRLFLAGVVATFKYADTAVHQLLFSKGKNIELPLTREYMYR